VNELHGHSTNVCVAGWMKPFSVCSLPRIITVFSVLSDHAYNITLAYGSTRLPRPYVPSRAVPTPCPRTPPTASPVYRLNSLSNSIRDIVVILGLVRNESDQTDHARDGKRQEGDVDVQGEVAAAELRVDAVRDGLTDSLERSEETTGSGGRLDVGRECTENPVDAELAPVSGAEGQTGATWFWNLGTCLKMIR